MSFDFSGWGGWGWGGSYWPCFLQKYSFSNHSESAGLLNNVLHLVLHLLLFISSILDDLESYYFVASQRSEQPKNVQLEPIVKRLNNDIFDQVGQSGKSGVNIKGSDALWQKS